MNYQHILRVQAFGGGAGFEDNTIEEPHRTDPVVWPSGVRAIDAMSGGFYGTTLIGGHHKIGKSLMLLRSSLLAATCGWTVLYFDGENEIDELQTRIANCQADVGGLDLRTWYPITFGMNASLLKLADKAWQQVDEDDPRLLICIDSLNRLAKRMCISWEAEPERKYRGAGGYFQALTEICEWSQAVTRLSQGNIGVMMTTEQNRAGKIVGMDPEYTCQCIVYISKHSEEPGSIDLTMDSRRTRGGPLGEHVRDYSRCYFRSVFESEDSPQPFRPDVSIDDYETPSDAQKELGF